MHTIQKIKRAVAELNPEERAEFRRWFHEFDAAEWDRQFEDDVAAGRLDALADAALAEHRAPRDQRELWRRVPESPIQDPEKKMFS